MFLFFKPTHFSLKRLSDLPQKSAPHDHDELAEQLALLNLDDQALQAEFQALQHHASALQKYATRIRYLISAMGKVPSEVLTEIFRLLCADDSLKEGDPLPPIILASVCQEWREIVVHDPRCWTTIPMVGRIRRESNKVNLTRQFIQRATLDTKAVLPLTILIDCLNISYQALGLLFEHSDSWKAIHLIGSSSYFKRCPLPDFPLLESVTFTGIADVFPRFLENTRALRQVSLSEHSVSPSVVGDRFHPQWSRVTVLVLNESSPNAIIALVQLCTSLESLTLVDIYSRQRHHNSVFPLPVSPVRLEKLRTLSITLGSRLPTDFGALCLLLSRMQVPELIVLKIVVCPIVHNSFGREWQNRHVEPLFGISNPKLKELHLDGVDITDTDLIDLLHRHLPTLVSLTVIEPKAGTRSHESQTRTLTTNFLSALNARGGLVPELRHIAFERSSQLRFDRSSFVRMVCSRTPCEGAGADARDRDDGSTTFTFGNVASAYLRSVSLRIEVPGADPVNPVDPMTVEAYRELRTRLGVVVVNDDDPTTIRERDPESSSFSQTFRYRPPPSPEV